MTDRPRIKILLVEDHILVSDLMARTLAAEPDFEIADQCATAAEGLQILRNKAVDVVLLDINAGIEREGNFLKRVQATGYRGKVLVITSGLSERRAAWLLNAGCSGIFLKTEPLATLVERIRGVMDGFTLDPHSVKAILSQMQGGDRWARRGLTAREAEVLSAVCEGLTNHQIADRLGASENTVKSFLQQLFRKAGVRTRAQLVTVAIEQYWDQLGN